MSRWGGANPFSRGTPRQMRGAHPFMGYPSLYPYHQIPHDIMWSDLLTNPGLYRGALPQGRGVEPLGEAEPADYFPHSQPRRHKQRGKTPAWAPPQQAASRAAAPEAKPDPPEKPMLPVQPEPPAPTIPVQQAPKHSAIPQPAAAPAEAARSVPVEAPRAERAQGAVPAPSRAPPGPDPVHVSSPPIAESQAGDEGQGEGGMAEERASTLIQSAWKGYEVRQGRPLELLRKLKAVEEKARVLEESVEAAYKQGGLPQKEKLGLAEGVMMVLLSLDELACPPALNDIRQRRKALARKLCVLQDKADSLKVLPPPAAAPHNQGTAGPSPGAQPPSRGQTPLAGKQQKPQPQQQRAGRSTFSGPRGGFRGGFRGSRHVPVW